MIQKLWFFGIILPLLILLKEVLLFDLSSDEHPKSTNTIKMLMVIF
jgi:hypothetical protein